MATPGPSLAPSRWRCACTIGQATTWLDLQAAHALTEGGEAAVILAEVAAHYLAVARRTS